MARSADFYLQDHSFTSEIGRLALRGGIISVASGYGGAVIQILSTVLLARLLTPEDFGLVAMVAAVTSFAPFLIDFGMTDAVVQRKSLVHDQLSGVFWISCALGIMVAAILAGMSGPIASIYHEPRLREIALLSATTFALSGISGPHLALLRRAMQFTAIAKIQLLGLLASTATAVLLAVVGIGYWALVVRPIANAAIVAIGAWHACRWRPGLPVFGDELKSMVRFGMHVVGTLIIYSISNAMDRIALGLFYSPTSVGYYQNATNLYDGSIRFAVSQIHNVGSAALSKLQSDLPKLREKYELALTTVAFIVMPVAAILSVTAEDLVDLAFGATWRSAGVLLGILATRGIFHVIEGSQGWLHLALGRADRWKKWGLVSALVQTLAILSGLPFGAKGVAISVVVSSALLAIPSISYAGRPAGIGASLVIRATGGQFVAAVLCGVTGWILKSTVLLDFSSLTRLLFLATGCTVIYLLVVLWLLRGRRHEAEALWRAVGTRWKLTWTRRSTEAENVHKASS